jgi:hypothetical protein
MGCRKMDYFAYIYALSEQAKLIQLSAEHGNIKQGVRPVASRIGLIVEKAESMHR